MSIKKINDARCFDIIVGPGIQVINKPIFLSFPKICRSKFKWKKWVWTYLPNSVIIRKY